MIPKPEASNISSLQCVSVLYLLEPLCDVRVSQRLQPEVLAQLVESREGVLVARHCLAERPHRGGEAGHRHRCQGGVVRVLVGRAGELVGRLGRGVVRWWRRERTNEKVIVLE